MFHWHSHGGLFSRPLSQPHSARVPGVPGSEARACTHPFPELVGQGVWGAASFQAHPPVLAHERPVAGPSSGVAVSAPGRGAQVALSRAQQSLDDGLGVHPGACLSDRVGLPSGSRLASDSANPWIVGTQERTSTVTPPKFGLLEGRRLIEWERQSHSRLLPSPRYGFLTAILQGMIDLVVQMRTQIREVKEPA